MRQIYTITEGNLVSEHTIVIYIYIYIYIEQESEIQCNQKVVRIGECYRQYFYCRRLMKYVDVFLSHAWIIVLTCLFVYY